MKLARSASTNFGSPVHATRRPIRTPPYELSEIGVLFAIACVLLGAKVGFTQIVIPSVPGHIVTTVGIPETGAVFSGTATKAIVSVRGKGAIDASGNFYFGDPRYYVVRKVNPAGEISTVAGNGHEGYSGDGKLAADSVENHH